MKLMLPRNKFALSLMVGPEQNYDFGCFPIQYNYKLFYEEINGC